MQAGPPAIGQVLRVGPPVPEVVFSDARCRHIHIKLVAAQVMVARYCQPTHCAQQRLMNTAVTIRTGKERIPIIPNVYGTGHTTPMVYPRPSRWVASPNHTIISLSSLVMYL